MTGSICDCNAPYTFGHRADCHLANFPVQATHVEPRLTAGEVEARIAHTFADYSWADGTENTPEALAAALTRRIFQQER